MHGARKARSYHLAGAYEARHLEIEHSLSLAGIARPSERAAELASTFAVGAIRIDVRSIEAVELGQCTYDFGESGRCSPADKRPFSGTARCSFKGGKWVGSGRDCDRPDLGISTCNESANRGGCMSPQPTPKPAVPQESGFVAFGGMDRPPVYHRSARAASVARVCLLS